MKSNKATGLDNIASEHLREMFCVIGPYLEHMFNYILDGADLASMWYLSKMKALFKGTGETKDPNAYRGIYFQSHTYKLLTSINAERVYCHVERRTLPDTQFGFRKGKSTIHAIQTINEIILKEVTNTGHMFIVFVDFVKAFDTIDRDVLMKKLFLLRNIKGKLFKVILKIMANNSIVININGKKSRPIKQSREVLQGNTLSPLLFSLYIADMPDSLINGNDNIRIFVCWWFSNSEY
ncbi:hypothetical protein GJ496_007929 [Pomphorhynchus laevis]|nr:hypothetical protein GJ496_007929 [Pomphorhynchus laevis]